MPCALYLSRLSLSPRSPSTHIRIESSLVSQLKMSAPPTASSSRRQSSSSAVSSPMAGANNASEELDGFAAALALQEAAARPGLAKKEVARLLEKVRYCGEMEREREKARKREREVDGKTEEASIPRKKNSTSSSTSFSSFSLLLYRPAPATPRPSSGARLPPEPSTTTPSPSQTSPGSLQRLALSTGAGAETMLLLPLFSCRRQRSSGPGGRASGRPRRSTTRPSPRRAHPPLLQQQQNVRLLRPLLPTATAARRR